MANTILQTRQTSLSQQLAGIVTEAEQMMGDEAFDPSDTAYVALRERREAVEADLADVIATMNARRLADTRPPVHTASGEPLSEFRQVLREYDRGLSQRVDVPYEILRELRTGDPYFTPSPTRIQVGELPIITPSLDSVATVPVGSNAYDFVVPPPVPLASEVAEGAQKPTRSWAATTVTGTLATDAHIIDVSRQTLEDDATAERTLRAWLTTGVRLQQDAKVAAAIAGATGTLTATGDTLVTALRYGKAALSTVGIRATAVHIHPTDAALADIEAMTSGHTGPDGVPTLWGMTVVENPAVPEGTPIVGAMRDAVYHLYRSAISTYITDSGMTNEATPRDRFSHNLLGILGEGRSRVHVVQPGLLVKCSVTVPVP